MRTVHRYTVLPTLPARLSCLRDLAYNLRWTWNHDTIDLFVGLGGDLWRESRFNPVLMLRRISQEQLDRAAEDEAFLAQLDRVCVQFRTYLADTGLFHTHHPDASHLSVAYFCMEFGIAECLPIYSGGLGVLAGDHLKAASGLGLPLVGMGLLYQKGYFSQYLSSDGWQLERYPINDFATMPIQPVRLAGGSPLVVRVDLAGRSVAVQVWAAQVGRISLYLLDTNLPENDPADQDVTDELYGGGPEERIRQEIVLGIGGMRALEALGIRPSVCHMNEGHSAFLSLERVRTLMAREGLDYRTARQASDAGTLFTTHTPVPAGFDLFPRALMERYFGDYVKGLGLTLDELLRKGRVHEEDQREDFNVAALAVRHSPRRNAVSRLHRRVTAHMMQEAWPGFPLEDVPVESITNGVLMRGWVSGEMSRLFDRYLGPRWQEDPADSAVWGRVETIPDEELWRAHVRQREHLVSYARAQLVAQSERRHASRREIDAAKEALTSDALTIGFARRFATYKRATLLLREVERLKAILLSERRPVQLIFSGKAHPRDDAGKDLIRQIVHFAAQEGLQHRIVFLEDYDLGKTRELVRGVDVWLNTPRRPMEASGTSGMKVVPNGGLNLSVLDGWWVEGYRSEVGWAIGSGEEYADLEYQDRVESQALYSLLEQEVIPLFFERSADGLPRGWIHMMKASMRHLGPAFSAARMVSEYAERFYIPAADHHRAMVADGYTRARSLAAWKTRVRGAWSEVSVVSVENGGAGEVAVGSLLSVEARVRLGSLGAGDVKVEAYSGVLTAEGQLGSGQATPLAWVAQEGDMHVYRGAVVCDTSGARGYAVRVLPAQEGVLIPNELALVTWE
jgi:glycogen phosphorylase